jgi:hypothetical protein
MEEATATYIGSEITDFEILERLPDDLQDFLNQNNGCIIFDGGLHIRGAVLYPDWHSLRKVWLGDFALYHLFPAMKKTDIPFAQDCLSDQFFLREDVVYKLYGEDGNIKSLHMDLKTFISRSIEDPVDFLLLRPLLQYQDEGGTLKPGESLSVLPPYCAEESANGVSIEAIPMLDRIRILADFAMQIADVPDGGKFEIIFGKPPGIKL